MVENGAGLAGRWCILRTQGRHTLRLAASLEADGYRVWTPAEVKMVSVPRVTVKREVRLPILASFVFAGAEHLLDLIRLADVPLKPRRGAGCREPAHVDFSVMRWHDKFPTITESALKALRVLEAKRKPRKKAERYFAEGAMVRVGEGSFGGMTGRVLLSNLGTTYLDMGGPFTRIEVETCLLSQDDIGAVAAS